MKPLRAAVVLALAGAAPALAADWVMLQGVLPPKAPHTLFGVVQASYANYHGCERMEGLRNVGPNAFSLLNGSYNAMCRTGPEFRDRQGAANLDNLILGAWGYLVPGRINYFLAANLGMNAANYAPLDTSRKRIASVTDASVTFSYVPGARLRAGLMRKPGPEELYQAVDAQSYIWPTDFVARVQTEKFVRTNTKGTTPIPGQGDGRPSFKGYDADAGRDWGVQVFDAFRFGGWSATYAVMVGNGSGIHDLEDYNGDKDVNLYAAAEYDLPGGKGAHKHGVKLYAWRQQGTRNFELDAAGSLSRDFDFTRHGFGVKALGALLGTGRGKHRLGIEAMYADGMIFYTPTGNVVDEAFGGQIQIAAEKGNKARGLTFDYGYYYDERWQLDLRLARHDLLRATVGNAWWSAADKRVVKQLTLGVNYHLSPATRITFNWEARDAKAPNAAANAIATANSRIVVDAVGARVGLQVTHKF